ncbi:MAG TPA: cyclic nucleotide-binding domain-containing protein [Candidatus Cybelea sp.]|nr:cyclic nucleotide-binding domain-containing protein [Candidatus Cybelea sp.]
MLPHDLIGNASYVILAASYLVTNITWLRLLAIVALTTEAVYFYLVGDRQLWVGILWAGIFNLINIVQLIILTRARMKVRMSEEEKTLHASIFGRLEKVDFSRILAVGRFEQYPDGTTLTGQDRPVESVHLLLSGRAHVIVDEQIIACLSAGDFVGEMAYIGRCTASATVITEGGCRSFRVGVEQLRALARKHEKIEAVMNARFSIDLARKLRTRPLTEPALRALRN